jgi:hypothetical protein
VGGGGGGSVCDGLVIKYFGKSQFISNNSFFFKPMVFECGGI